VTESSKEVELVDLPTSGTTERNRYLSWESGVQRSTKSAVDFPISKIGMSHRPLMLARSFTKSIVAIPIKLLYTFLKLGFGIAKYSVRGLSRIRRLLFAPR